MRAECSDENRSLPGTQMITNGHLGHRQRHEREEEVILHGTVRRKFNNGLQSVDLAAQEVKWSVDASLQILNPGLHHLEQKDIHPW